MELVKIDNYDFCFEDKTLPELLVKYLIYFRQTKI